MTALANRDEDMIVALADPAILLDYRLLVEQIEGQWQIAAFIAGD